MNETETLENQEDQYGPDTDSQSEPEDKLRSQIEQINIAEELDDEELKEISRQCKDGFEYDLQSRSEWEDNLDSWTKLALQVKEEKTFPWVNASNVKYPLLSTAAMQFNARAYPSLVPANGEIVNVEVIGKDPQGMRSGKAERISTFMSYQLLNDMENWEDDMDKLLVMLPIIGTVFKKTYYSGLKKKIISELILPKNIVVNYWAKSLDTAERISEIIQMSKRRLKEKQMSEEFLDIDLGDPQPREGKIDETTPYELIEQHTFYDLDHDGYSEPYVVTFERHSGKVLRIIARYDEKGIQQNDKGKLQKIEPIQYYTKFSFIPNPDGGFYDMGFGLLLAPLNESVNTIINQLIDAGTISNLQGGFLGKGLKLKMGESRFTPGEWKTVNSTSDDLRKQVIPLPVKEPSNVLFQLMGTLVTSGKELASVAEIFVGKMPGQNTPATTTMATIEQGMKVFTAVYKRVYRSLKSEFKKIFELNNNYLDMQEYQMVVNEPLSRDDFNPDQYDVCPSADPSIATQTEKLMKAQGLMELMQLGTLDPVEVTRRILDAQEQSNADKLLHPVIQQTGQMPQQPDPKTMELQMKGQLDQQKFQLQQQHDAFKSQLEERDQLFKHQMEAQKQAMEAQHEQVMTTVRAAAEYHANQAKIQGEAMRHNQAMQHADQQHNQQMRHQEEAGKLKIQQQKSGSKTGKSTK
jgi:chaperonin GroES